MGKLETCKAIKNFKSTRDDSGVGVFDTVGLISCDTCNLNKKVGPVRAFFENESLSTANNLLEEIRHRIPSRWELPPCRFLADIRARITQSIVRSTY